MIIKLVYELIILLITPVSVYFVLLRTVAAHSGTYYSYRSMITTHQCKFLRKNHNSFIGYMPRDSLVITITI